MNLSINAGFYNTKIKGADGLSVFESKAQLNADGSSTLIIDNEVWEVGAGHRSLDDKTDSKIHRLCTEYAILKHAKAEKVNLMVALPLQFYLNRDYREKYRQGLLGEHNGTVDGDHKKVTVIDCTVYAEGAAAYLRYKETFKNKSVGILDFGGNTINCMVFACGKLVKDTISTLDLGMIKLERAIIDALNTEKLMNIQDYELRDYMQRKDCKAIIDRVTLDHITQVRTKLIEKKWNIDNMQLFCTGGGAAEIGCELCAIFKNCIISEDGLYDNVEGLDLAAAVLYGG